MNYLASIEIFVLLEAVLGLTYSQIIATLIMIGGYVAAWVNLNIKITEVRARITAIEGKQAEKDISIETMRKENNDQHADILDKLNDFMLNHRCNMPPRRRK